MNATKRAILVSTGAVLIIGALAGGEVWTTENTAMPACTGVVARQTIVDSLAQHPDLVTQLEEQGARLSVEEQPDCQVADNFFVHVNTPILRADRVKELMGARPDGLGFTSVYRWELRY